MDISLEANRHRRSLFWRVFTLVERICSHAIGPVGAGDRDALADLVLLVGATIETLGPDDLHRRCAIDPGAVELLDRNPARIAAD